MIDPDSIAFDIDGVVADTMRLFLDIARKEFHIHGIRYEDFTRYRLSECTDMDPEIILAIIDKIHDDTHGLELNPIAGAPAVIRRIANGNRPLLFVTARPSAGPIQSWLQDQLRLGPGDLEVVATGDFDAKTEVLKQRQVRFFVEDRLETCFSLDAAGVVPIVFHQPWNRQAHPFMEVASWGELEALIAFDDRLN
jgi:5'(3')-deoxyribonucleotidase